LRLHSFATFTVGKVLSEGPIILIKTTTTLTFVTTHCFGGRHDDREIVNDEREGLDMNRKERVGTNKERGEREREREEEKMSNAFREGAVSTRSPMVTRNKQNKRQERKRIGVIILRKTSLLDVFMCIR
jgi:hypothetical protein